MLKRLPSQRCAGLGRDTEEKVGSLALETCREGLGSHLLNVQLRDYFPGGEPGSVTSNLLSWRAVIFSSIRIY